MRHMNNGTWFSSPRELKINESRSYCGIIICGKFQPYIGQVDCPDCIKLYFRKHPDEKKDYPELIKSMPNGGN